MMDLDRRYAAVVDSIEDDTGFLYRPFRPGKRARGEEERPSDESDGAAA